MLTISRNVLSLRNLKLDQMFVVVLSKFPHYWVFLQIYSYQMWKFWAQNRLSEKWVFISIKHNSIVMIWLCICSGECHICPPSDLYYIIWTLIGQDVCHSCCLFCWWKPDNIDWEAQWNRCQSQSNLVLHIDLMSYTTVGMWYHG